jgi:hypothetical protein
VFWRFRAGFLRVSGSYAIAALVLISLALIAAVIPAFRGAKTDSMTALRAE